MGNRRSELKIAEELMEDYLQFTFLTKNDILQIHKRLSHLESGIIYKSIQHRFGWRDILKVFPELQVNPFSDRLLAVFSSEVDGRMSFEDMLDLYSALSPNCPSECKAQWAFKIFDFNGSNSIERDDIFHILDRITSGEITQSEQSECLPDDEKEKIATIILNEADLDQSGYIVRMEFVRALSKIPDFNSSFTLKL